MHTLRIVNMVITIVFIACYFYQFIYIPIALFGRKNKKDVEAKEHNFQPSLELSLESEARLTVKICGLRFRA